jgi:site-specific recombinase XerD
MNKWYNLYNLEASFKKYLLAGNISQITLKNYLSDLRHFLGWLTFYWKSNNVKIINELSLQELSLQKLITTKTISDYKAYLLENNIPLKTTNRRLSTVRKFCSFCISQGWLKENPAKKIKNEKIKDKNLPFESGQENKKILKSFQEDLQKENLDQSTIKSYLEVIQDFLSL